MNEKYSWNLADIFANKSKFDETKNKLNKLLTDIQEYKDSICKSAENLYNCYNKYEKALELLEKLYAYGMLNYHLDMSNQENIKLFKEVEALEAEFGTVTSFITPELIYTDTEVIEKYLKEEPKLSKYARIIKDTLKEKEHILSKSEEELLSNYTEVFSAPENIFDILTNAEFEFGKLTDEENNEVEMTESNYTVYVKSQNEKVRKQAFKLMYNKYKEFINTISEIYLTNVKSSNINARVRKYNSALDEAVHNDDASIKVYNSLIESVHKNLKYNHEFIELKKKLLNKKDFHMYDLYVNPFEEEKDEICFEDAKNEVLAALSIMGKEYTKKLNEAFENSWVDVYAMPNKRSGAYSMGVYNVHPYVLLNFVNSKRDVSTIAHELGHSMHSFYSSSNQNVIDANYTIMVAEVASTVNEILLSEYQIKNEKDKKKKAEILYELLEMIRATFFRQAMFAEFEKIVHEKIENKQMLSAEDLNKIYYKLNQKYFGNNMIIDDEIKYEWARIPHFYTDFYVYKYSTGISAAICIASNILKQGETFVNRYIEMLKQGCSKKSIELLKMVDVDLESTNVYQNTADFYNEKLKQLKEMIE